MRLMELDAPIQAKMTRAGQKRMADWGPDRFAERLLADCTTAEHKTTHGISLWCGALLLVLSSRSIEAVQ